MDRSLRAGWLSVLMLAGAWSAAMGQEENPGEWRAFQDKDGNRIEARAVALSSDFRRVQILRRDGRAFDLTVTRLSLDDQQHLRDWYLSLATPKPDQMRFDLTIAKAEKPLSRERLTSAVKDALWEKREYRYDIRLTSLSSVPLSGLKLEYTLLMEDVVKVTEPDKDASPPTPGDEDDDALPRWRTLPECEIRYFRGTIDLPELTYNRPHATETASLAIDALKSSDLDREISQDRPAGLLIRLVDAEGHVLHQQSDLSRQHLALNWDTLSNRWDPREEAGSGVLINSVAKN
ncbi:MAG: hypothetical protein JNK37_09410 [Verrucomicrobiales bacterium]|nr:hypothetical protein [Verrucomicrobiales bacterium]